MNRFLVISMSIVFLVIVACGGSVAIDEKSGNTVYEFSAKSIDGEYVSIGKYEGKILLIVNTASKCGFTYQYEGLQELYDEYKDDNFVVLGFPSNQFMNQEPGSDEDIKQFCEQNFGVTFPLFSKIDVKGENQHPLFYYLTSNEETAGEIGWNFTKFLINEEGQPISRYEPSVEPKEIKAGIEQLIQTINE